MMEEYERALRFATQLLGSGYNHQNLDFTGGNLREIASGLISISHLSGLEIMRAIDYENQGKNLQKAEDYLPIKSVNLSLFSLMVGNRLLYERKRQMSLGIGALLCDVGMTQTIRELCDRTPVFTHRERVTLERHSRIGAMILRRVKGVDERVIEIVNQHHEQFNGGGYPEQRRGKQIIEEARIVNVADFFLGITSAYGRGGKRRYLSYSNALAVMTELGERNYFDPQLFDVFNSLFYEE